MFTNLQDLLSDFRSTGKLASIVAARKNDRRERNHETHEMETTARAGDLYKAVVRVGVSAARCGSSSPMDPARVREIDSANNNLRAFNMQERNRKTGERGQFMCIGLDYIRAIKYRKVAYAVENGILRALSDTETKEAFAV